jgi:hypothetical protein
MALMKSPAVKAEIVKENKFEFEEVTLERSGTKIILPNSPKEMTTEEAIIALQRIQKEEQTKVSVNEVVEAFPFDGAYAFMKAMKQTYGWATPVPTKTFFGDRPPNTVSLEIGPNQTTQIIWGEFQVPGIEGTLSTGVWRNDDRFLFCIQGVVRKANMSDVKKLADLTRQIVATESIYRGKAIRLRTDEEGDVNFLV